MRGRREGRESVIGEGNERGERWRAWMDSAKGRGDWYVCEIERVSEWT